MKILILASLLATGIAAHASIETHLQAGQQATIVLNVGDARLRSALRDVLVNSPEITAVDNMYVQKNTQFTAPGITIYSKDATELTIVLEESPAVVNFSAAGNFIRFSTETGIAKTLFKALSSSSSRHVISENQKLVVMATPGNYINPNFSCRNSGSGRYDCELHD
jgi:hypothetical protein